MRHSGPGVSPSVVETIGSTPMVALERLCEGRDRLVLAKLEYYSPGHSVKDRIARRMVERAEARGLLVPGGAIVETTSGNTGIGLAIVAAVRGYRFLAVMSEGNSVERQRILRSLGAEVVLVPQAGDSRPGQVSGEDLQLVERRAEEVALQLGAFRPDQFENPDNAAAHAETTGVEIWEQTGGRLDAWVASVGTAGTFAGVARALKARCPSIRCVVAEPATVRPLAGIPVTNSSHQIQGTGYNRIPPLFDAADCDAAVGVTDREAIETARDLAAREGIVGGFSGGANVWAALQVARELAPGSVVVTVIPDTGLKYLSTNLYP